MDFCSAPSKQTNELTSKELFESDVVSFRWILWPIVEGPEGV